MSEMAKAYDPKSFESRWYERWEREGHFRPKGIEGTPSFTIVIPPPNVTGALTIGHVLNNTIQDVLIRSRRMQGYRHPLAAGHGPRRHRDPERGQERSRGARAHGRGDRPGEVRRRSLGVEGAYGGQIIRQLRLLGCFVRLGAASASPSIRVSPARSSTAFKHLYRKGLDLPRRSTWSTGASAARRRSPTRRSSTRTRTTSSTTSSTRSKGPIAPSPWRPPARRRSSADTAVAVNPEDERYEPLRRARP